jgi:hypothetical protein
MAHANARLGPAGRRELVRLICEMKWPERRAAECLSVSPTTAHRWKRRWLEAGAEDRCSGAWAADRSSRPHRSPRRTCHAKGRGFESLQPLRGRPPLASSVALVRSRRDALGAHSSQKAETTGGANCDLAQRVSLASARSGLTRLRYGALAGQRLERVAAASPRGRPARRPAREAASGHGAGEAALALEWQRAHLQALPAPGGGGGPPRARHYP